MLYNKNVSLVNRGSIPTSPCSNMHNTINIFYFVPYIYGIFYLYPITSNLDGCSCLESHACFLSLEPYLVYDLMQRALMSHGQMHHVQRHHGVQILVCLLSRCVVNAAPLFSLNKKQYSYVTQVKLHVIYI